MSQNENLYKFIDVDKLLPFLREQLDSARSNAEIEWECGLLILIDKIEGGFFSFQKGGE